MPVSAKYIWSDAVVAKLKAMWAAGKSAGQIASALGGGITRNAVIGKVHRLKLAKRATPNVQIKAAKVATDRQRPSAWTQERVQQLTALWCAGTPAQDIALALGLSKGAVLTKRKVLGLPPRDARGAPLAPAPAALSLPDHAAQTVVVPAADAYAPRGLHKLAGEAWEALPGSTPVRLEDLRPGQCKWPIGGPDLPFSFCAETTVEGGVYCKAHAQRAFYQPVETKPVKRLPSLSRANAGALT